MVNKQNSKGADSVSKVLFIPTGRGMYGCFQKTHAHNCIKHIAK